MESPSLSRATSHTLQLRHCVPKKYAFGSVANIGLAVWLSQADEAATLAMLDSGEHMLSPHPEGISGIQWLRNASHLPTSEARGLFAEFIRQHGSKLGDMAIVLGADGFWASALRGMLTGLRLATGNRIAFRICTSLEEVLTWLPAQHESRTGVTVTREEIHTAMQELARHCEG